MRQLSSHQYSQLMAVAHDSGQRRVIYETDWLIEAPNWTVDGKSLVFNAQGRLFQIDASGRGNAQEIPLGGIQTANNDHVLSPCGSRLYFSASDHIYCVPLSGGVPRKLSPERPPDQPLRLFLHGISPDERWLTCVGVASHDFSGPFAIYTLPSEGGAALKQTHALPAVDGPEISPDGEWLYYNSEWQSRRPGHAQIFRSPFHNGRLDEGRIEALTTDDRVNWFPHLSPDGEWLAYISFASGTLGHPADQDVLIRLLDLKELATGVVYPSPVDVVGFRGGQGSLNVNSWAPDSKSLAYVAYPYRAACSVY